MTKETIITRKQADLLRVYFALQQAKDSVESFRCIEKAIEKAAEVTVVKLAMHGIDISTFVDEGS